MVEEFKVAWADEGDEAVDEVTAALLLLATDWLAEVGVDVVEAFMVDAAWTGVVGEAASFSLRPTIPTQKIKEL